MTPCPQRAFTPENWDWDERKNSIQSNPLSMSGLVLGSVATATLPMLIGARCRCYLPIDLVRNLRRALPGPLAINPTSVISPGCSRGLRTHKDSQSSYVQQGGPDCPWDSLPRLARPMMLLLRSESCHFGPFKQTISVQAIQDKPTRARKHDRGNIRHIPGSVHASQAPPGDQL